MADAPLLVLGDFTLRPWRRDDHDIATLLVASGDPYIRRFSSVGQVRNRADAEAWLRARSGPAHLDWAVERHSEFAGRVGLRRLSREDVEAEVGYWLLPQQRGAGLMTAAVLALTRWAFSDGGLGRLEIRHELDNNRSCAVAERCGYAAEGTQRGALLRDDVRHDLHLHGKLATDPEPS